jgi:putative sugar O-methyltransferase
MLFDDDALDFLELHASKADPKASSHWREMHSAFSAKNRVLSGLNGFGSIGRRNLLFNFAHSLFQLPYRKMARDLPRFDEIEQIAKKLAKMHHRAYNFDFIRQSLVLAWLYSKSEALAPGKTLVVIGDGFATLASLALMVEPKLKIVLVNLTKTLLVDALYLRKAFPDKRIALLQPGALKDGSEEQISLVQAIDADLLRSIPIDLAVNIGSFQEMDMAVIQDYFSILRESKPLLYTCNRIQKKLPDGSVIRFHEYPWKDNDEIFEDSLCPWSQGGYMLRPPFYFQMDGPVQHRLVRLA